PAARAPAAHAPARRAPGPGRSRSRAWIYGVSWWFSPSRILVWCSPGSGAVVFAGGGIHSRGLGLPGPVEVPAGGADHAQLPVLDQGHGNLLQRLAHRPFVEEARDEAAAF